MKKYLIIGIIISVGIIAIQQCYNNKIKKQRDIAERNLEIADFVIDSVRNENGSLQAEVSQLYVDKSTFEKINKGLSNDLNNMKLKVKELQSATKIEIQYKYIKDTINQDSIKRLIVDSLQKDTKKWGISISDQWLSFNQVISYKIGDSKPIITELGLQLKDNIIVANEFETKRRWFLFIPLGKKVIGTKVHLKSENPYFRLDRVETYQFNNKLSRKGLY